MKKRFMAVALAGGVALGGSFVGTVVLPASSAHGSVPPRCLKFINQDHFFDNLASNATPGSSQQNAFNLASTVAGNNFQTCRNK